MRSLKMTMRSSLFLPFHFILSSSDFNPSYLLSTCLQSVVSSERPNHRACRGPKQTHPPYLFGTNTIHSSADGCPHGVRRTQSLEQANGEQEVSLPVSSIPQALELDALLDGQQFPSSG